MLPVLGGIPAAQGAVGQGNQPGPGQICQDFSEQPRYRLGRGAAGIEDFHRRTGQGGLVVPVERIRGNGLHILHIAQPGHAKIVLAAHGLEHLPVGVGLLVVQGGFNGID